MLYTLKYKNFVINGTLGGLGEVQDLPRWAEIEELVAAAWTGISKQTSAQFYFVVFRDY